MREFPLLSTDRRQLRYAAVQQQEGIRFHRRGRRRGDDARYISQSVPTSLTAGESRRVSITMENSGVSTWTAGAYYRLGAQDPRDNTTWGASRIYLSTI